MTHISLHQQIEQALRNALSIQADLHTGGDPVTEALAEDDVFLQQLLDNPGILELVRDVLENEDENGIPMRQPGGFERALKTRLQRELREIASEYALVNASKKKAIRS